MALPKLRFPEFREAADWRESTLGDISEMRAGKFVPATDIANKSSDGWFPCFGGNGLRGYTKSFTHEGKYSLIGRQGALCGNVRLFNGTFHATEHAIVVTPESGIQTDWLFYALGLLELNKYSLGQAQPGLSVQVLEKVSIAVPRDLEEQKKIADCLTSLDELIAAQGQKVEALKAHKRGLMQQLFPHEGESQPRLRFPEFNNAPEWQPTILDQLSDVQSGSTPSKVNPNFWNGSIPWVSAKDMKQLFLEDTEDHISTAAVEDGARVVPAGALLILTRGMMLLKDIPICVLRREMSLNQDVKALRPKGDVNGLFLAYLLLGNKHRLLTMVDIAGHGTGKLNTDELKAFELAFPNPNEQQRISDCFSSLDNRISAESNQLTALKAHKHGLMQHLFPAPETTYA
jgi:type I restriction enzyme, S subunit